jgi:hypothetical protein
MSLRPKYRSAGRRLWPLALVGAILATAPAVPSGAVAASPSGITAGLARAGHPPLGATPTQVIDAQKDPDAAAQALSAGCAEISNCSLASLSSISDGYGPPEILGDALYNCSPPGGPDADTAVGVSDTRGETTSVSEMLSVTLQGGLIGIASTSAEFSAFSSQSQTFSTTVMTTSQVTVPPGYKGFTTTQVLSANATASYYITSGIHLIEVTGIDLTFPGYQDNQTSGDSQVIYNGVTEPINPVLSLNYETIPPCNAVNDNPSSGLGGVRPKLPTGSFKLTVCPPDKRCVTHTLAGPPPPKIRQATAILTRTGRRYATGTDIRGRIRLKQQRKITAGKYRLIIKQKPKKLNVRQHGKRPHTAEQHMVIAIPVDVCGDSASPSNPAPPHFGNSCKTVKP